MAKEFKMPQMDATMETGIIVKWLKQEGDFVKRGEPLVEITTDKVNIEIESLDSGILKKILAQPGDEIPVAQVIAYIGQEGEAIAAQPVIPPTQDFKSEDGPVTKEISTLKEEGPNIKISPIARKLATESGLDMRKLVGTGPEGRITKEDVLKAIEEINSKPSVEATLPVSQVEIASPRVARVISLTGMRKTIAKKLADSFREAPHIVITMTADMTYAKNLRDSLLPVIEKKVGVRLSYTDLILKAAALALREFPLLNAGLIKDEIQIYQDINIGLAVSLPDGLIVPTLRAVDQLSLTQLALKRSELVKKAQQGTLNHAEVSGGTFTLTNLGTYGVEYFSAIINPPQTAILAAGSILDKVAASNGQIVIRPEMILSVSADHRVVDGALVAQFLAKTKEMLEKPSLLLDHD